MLKKKLVSILLAVAMVMGVSLTAQAVSTDDNLISTEEQYTNTLTAYMEGLDKIYVTDAVQTFSVRESLTDVEQQWKQHIANWANDVEISILTQKSDFTIKEVVSENDTEIKLLVYVWTDLEYENDGYSGVVETMGFGIDHIFTLTKNGNNDFSVLDDCFIDGITDYCSGYAENFALLPTASKTDGDFNETGISPLAATIPSTPVYSAYKPATAVAYSNKWVGHKSEGNRTPQTPSGYNPEYYYYTGDCVNFVSQCMLEGGMPQSSSTINDYWWVKKNTGSTTPVEDTAYTKSGLPWRSPYYFAQYWIGQGYTSTTVDTSKKAVAGNPLYTSEHLMLIVGTNANGKIIYNAHNNDAYHCLYTPSSSLKTIELVHNYSYSDLNLYSHTKNCSVCGEETREGHTWVDATPTGYRCTVCGYRSNTKPEVINRVGEDTK